jgi:hypothetical protein
MKAAECFNPKLNFATDEKNGKKFQIIMLNIYFIHVDKLLINVIFGHGCKRNKSITFFLTKYKTDIAEPNRH